MKISYNWLRKYIDTDLDPQQLAEKLTSLGLEVEDVSYYSNIPQGVENIVVGHVTEVVQHPNADRLRLTKVDVGSDELLSIVCGAPNVAKGQKVPVATIGTTIHPTGGEPFTIKRSKIRGELSEGMICAEDEIGLGTSHEGIMVLDENTTPGKPLTDYLPFYKDWIIEIGLTPNRVDAASHIGVARDLAALLGTKVKYPDVKITFDQHRKSDLKLTIEDEEACPRYSGMVIEGVKVAESPQWLQDALKAIGQQPVNNIVDITNYVMLEMGHPLHAFDMAKIKGDEIVVKRSQAGQSFTTLDKLSRKLDGSELMICNAEEPMAIGGVFGGLDSGISESTTTIFIESAYFNPSVIRQASRKHQLFTDASFRFERGADPNGTLKALDRAAALVVEIAGGNILVPLYDNYPQQILPEKVKLPHAYLKRLSGMEIPQDEVKRILTGLEMVVLEETEEHLLIEVPTFKTDVKRPADIVEEIMRIYSYDKVPLKTQVNSILQVDTAANREKRRQKIATWLVGQGFSEAYSLSMVNRAENELTGNRTAFPILNPLSQEQGEMRTDMLVPGLKNILHNLNRQQHDVKLYEWGSIHYRDEEGTRLQHRMLGIWMTGHMMPENWHSKGRKVDFYYAKGIAEKLLAMAHVEGCTTEPADIPWLDYGYVCRNKKGKQIGCYGKVSDKILKKLDIGQEVFYITFETPALLPDEDKKFTYEPYSRFPKMERDMALQVPVSLQYREVESLIKNTERKLLKRISVFDVYQGSQLPEGFKSYGVRLEFEDPERTLEDKAIDKVMGKITHRLQQELNIQIR